MTLVKSAAQPLAQQLAERFAQRIRSRLLAPGTRLPSVRQCAQQQGVSPSTVVAAYDRLLAQGLIEAQKNRGFYTRNQALPPVVQALAAIENEASGLISAAQHSAVGALPLDLPPVLPHVPVDAAALIRGMFYAPGGRAQPGMGAFPSEWLASNFMAAALRRFCTTSALNAASLHYGEPAGDVSLREAVAARLNTLGIAAGAGQVITTLGATHALDIISRTLLRPGDCVMVEEPGWAVEFARLDALGMRILPVPRGVEGPDLEVMARMCELHQPKLFVSVSVFHNPTGYCLSAAHAHRVLQLAHRYAFEVVEDDTYSHIAPDHATRVCALDGLERSIYVSGFAKILAPGWRVGYLAAPPRLVERLLDTKLLGTLTTPALFEKALAWCMTQGQLRRHALQLRTRLDLARSRSVALALQAGCQFASPPAGLFGWVDTGVDTDKLALRMLDVGYLLAPGALFHANHAPSTLMRINFCTTQDAQFWQVFEAARAELARKGL
ncbi:PLP-dependent aminotransferase family protein [Rhodoferax sp.]|uniref:aminotransferase-like domain-containing protein n=1 Tax=Rhodoferax sp. TaxID=50421 RepID=UPI0026077F95|nr:PLP-dependent aminotransferase family protein [Rhodoferax sp.]MDD5478599.1 PLP-dependent aminotransferase family protein [Rhodoferax sp.]